MNLNNNSCLDIRKVKIFGGGGNRKPLLNNKMASCLALHWSGAANTAAPFCK